MTTPESPSAPDLPTAPASPTTPSVPTRPSSSGLAVFGAILVLLGVFFGIQQLIGETFSERWWPLLVMVPGVALLVVGLMLANAGMIIGGTVVTTVGAVLLYQSETGLWATWAYAWALVGPTAAGVGSVLGGWRTANGELVRSGGRTALIGLLLFVIGYLFFEQVIGLSGDPAGIPEWILPAVLIGAGVVILAGVARGWTTHTDG